MSNPPFGSFAWMQLTNGQLSPKEKIKLAKKALLPTLLACIRSQLQLYSAKIDIHLEKTCVPDSQMIVHAIDELQAKASAALIHHSWRTYFLRWIIRYPSLVLPQVIFTTKTGTVQAKYAY